MYGVGQVSGGPQEGFDSSKNYGASTGTGPGARSDYPDIPRDGGFGGKPTPPERLMGKLTLLRLSICGMSLDHWFCLQVLQKSWSERLPATLECTNMARNARYVNLRISTSLAHMAALRLEDTKLWPHLRLNRA